MLWWFFNKSGSLFQVVCWSDFYLIRADLFCLHCKFHLIFFLVLVVFFIAVALFVFDCSSFSVGLSMMNGFNRLTLYLLCRVLLCLLARVQRPVLVVLIAYSPNHFQLIFQLFHPHDFGLCKITFELKIDDKWLWRILKWLSCFVWVVLMWPVAWLWAVSFTDNAEWRTD